MPGPMLSCFKDHRNGCTKSIKSVYIEFQFERQIEEYTGVVTAEIDRVTHTKRTLTDHFATDRGELLPYLCSKENKCKAMNRLASKTN